MNTINTSKTPPQNQGESCRKTNHEDVARAAFSIYEKHGSQNGQDIQNWLEAEAHVKAKHANIVHGNLQAAKVVNQSTL